ncbi:MAG TPA: phosphotransferase [Candidatus Dormibacteraeota bacterium]|nr:phosphotransferase [Candidatus Dormibacteraeota bacterium]
MDVPPAVARLLPIADARPMGAGGTPATVWRLQLADGRLLALKVLAAGAGLVDGHDLETFVRKPAQLALIHAEAPGLRALFVRVEGHLEAPGWAAYWMPFCAGAPLSGRLLSDPAADGLSEVARVLTPITEDGYARLRRPAAPGGFERDHVQRVARRAWLLEERLDPDLFDPEGIVVNDRLARPARALLDRLASRPDLLRRLDPRFGYFPVHGDLNLGNVLVRDGSFTVLDPRGTLDPLDPVYDFAKVAMSLSGYDQAMSAGFAIERRRPDGGRPRYELRLRRRGAGYRAAAMGLPDRLAALPFVRAELELDDPCWRARLLFARAFHFLAEAACRLSDPTARSFGAVRGQAARVELATGFYLIGVSLLTHLLDQPSPCDAADPHAPVSWM